MSVSSFTVALINKAEIVAKLAGYRAGLQLKANMLERSVAREVAIVAKDLVPVDSGKTKDSIRAEKYDGHWAVIVDRNGDRPDVPVYLEMGTRFMAARPFLTPAADLVIASGSVERITRDIGGLIIGPK